MRKAGLRAVTHVLVCRGQMRAWAGPGPPNGSQFKVIYF